MALIGLKQRLSRVSGFFRTPPAASGPGEGRKQATDRLVAVFSKGQKAAVAELQRLATALEAAHKGAVTELTRIRRADQAIVAELRAISAAHLAQLSAISAAHLAQLSAISAAIQAEKKDRSEMLKRQQAIVSQLDAVGAIGLAEWQGKHPELATCPLVASMLARRRVKRSASGSTGVWMFLERNQESLGERSALLYERLPPADQHLFVRWLLYKWCGVDALEPGEQRSYMDLLSRVKALPPAGSIQIGATKYDILDLNPLGLDIRFAGASHNMLVNDFCLNQYVHPMVHPREGDVLLDLGGYIGDTAIMFGRNTEYNCQVHSFEMSATNIQAFQANLELNPRMLGRTAINRLAVADTTGATVAFGGDSQSEQISHYFRITEGGSESVETVTIDDYVTQRSLDRVDVIKMDVEGAERLALRGAVRTIARFKPRLAVAIYHIEDDPLVIPRLILDANPNYRFGFRWCNKKNGNEGILFAIDAEELDRLESQASSGAPLHMP